MTDWKDEPCIDWPVSSRSRLGYGRLYVRGVGQVFVHRWIWEQIHGPIPDGMVICHHCDHPPCFNPSHLFAGTQADNVRDGVSKGRYRGNGYQHLTHCKRGHPLDEDNTYTWKNSRHCKACRRYRYHRAKAQS